MKEVERIIGKLQKASTMLLIVVLVLGCLPATAFAAASKEEIKGSIYEFDKGSHYEFHENSDTLIKGSGTNGTLTIGGKVAADGEKSGVPAYKVSEGKLEFYYDCADALLTENLDAWHVIEDKSKKVADMKLDEDILKGAIILQVSKDRMNWSDVDTITNAFSDASILDKSIYTTTDVQLINGCFYRVIVVYELEKRVKDSNILFINTDKYEKKKCAEIFEFYAILESKKEDEVNLNDRYSWDDRVRVDQHDGYFGEKPIDEKDIHYKWKIGDFFVTGFTSKEPGPDGNMVFLKNVGDKVTLGFNLKHNIDALNGNEKLSITADEEGHDQYFETARMDFGRGTVIIRHIDHNNNKENIIYTNYLEATASVGADTKVHLCEEGDYEVALDYEVTSDELIDKIGHYRMFFKFSVRNGNCMFYPFDLGTGSELTNRDVTENGFRLSLAGSNYLKISIKREVLKDSADGLVEDTRFNQAAKDGSEFTEEGIYTITVRNEYTEEETTKRIYVGSNMVMKAHMVTGRSISDINTLLDQGAAIAEDGTIQLAAAPQIQAEPETNTEDSASVPESTQDQQEAPTETEEQGTGLPIAPIVGVTAVCAIVLIIALTKKKGTKQAVQDNVNEGGNEQ